MLAESDDHFSWSGAKTEPDHAILLVHVPRNAIVTYRHPCHPREKEGTTLTDLLSRKLLEVNTGNERDHPRHTMAKGNGGEVLRPALKRARAGPEIGRPG